MMPLTHSHLAALLALALIADGAGQSAPSSPATTAEVDPPRPIAEEAAVLEKGRISARHKAFARLATHPDPAADDLLLAQFDHYRAGNLPPSLWLDLFEAAAKRNTPSLKARLAERERTLAESRDPLSRFRECLEGGDGAAGRLVFTQKAEAGCIHCHTVSGEGGKIGPDLTWLRNAMERTQILESIITPNSVIAPGFGSVALTLKNGSSLSGVVNYEDAAEITITSTADGKKTTVKTADIAERMVMPSPMPPHFGTVLDKRAIRDLVQYIAAGD